MFPRVTPGVHGRPLPGAWVDRTPEEAAERDRYLASLRGPGLGYKIAAMRGEPPLDHDKDLSR